MLVGLVALPPSFSLSGKQAFSFIKPRANVSVPSSKSTQYKKLAPNAHQTLSFQFFTTIFSILIFFVLFLHVVFKISNFEKHLVKPFCTELTLQELKRKLVSWSFVRHQIASSKSTSKIRQKFSVIKTNTSDDIKKIVHFGILIQSLS